MLLNFFLKVHKIFICLWPIALFIFSFVVAFVFYSRCLLLTRVFCHFPSSGLYVMVVIHFTPLYL